MSLSTSIYGIAPSASPNLRAWADTSEGGRVDVRALNAFKEYRQFRSQEGDEEAETALGPKWPEAIGLCREVLAHRKRSDEQEVTYKHEIAAHIRAALEAAEREQPIVPALKKAPASRITSSS